MSAIGSWAYAIISKSQLSLQNQSERRNASVQTLLSASGTGSISKEWLHRSTKDTDDDVDYLARDFDEDEKEKPQRVRRKRIPDRPNHQLGLWAMLKDFIGQNLTNVALPVNINEPLSLLQRMAETFESSYLLDRAADCENIYDQMAYLAAFSITGYAVSAERNGKPFNPLLGETYEFDRTGDLGWKCLVEQVSHHPSISALHCESKKWTWWEDLCADLSFRGKYIRIMPGDYRYVKFTSNQKTYRIGRAETYIHNILFGKVWVDHSGKVKITCLDDVATCNLTYVPSSSFSRANQRMVIGEVRDSSKVKRLIRAVWNKHIEMASDLDDENRELTDKTATFETIWQRKPLSPASAKYYNFSDFACELNEFESSVAPTDSRLRPDLRLMEEAKFDEANAVKLRLENKQRQAIYQRDSDNAASLVAGDPANPYKPTWFRKTMVPGVTGVDEPVYIYIGGYWEAKRKGDWSMCPDIF
ncbi:hypothetical protein HA402_008293 [Bradysia odoriphaga]|nr:hypothetical protein HA402_008293 [Bradysia odoriphaga]